MSFMTKLFILLSLFTSLVFVLVSGTMVAKQENYKRRLAQERLMLEKERRVQSRLADMLAALKEEKRRLIYKERERLLQIQRDNHWSREAMENWLTTSSEVQDQLTRFNSVTDEFQDIEDAYRATLEELVERCQTLAERKNDVMTTRSLLWLHVAEVTAKVGRMREDLNVLDYQLYHVNVVNQQKRELIRQYNEIIGGSPIPDPWGDLRPYGDVTAVADDYEGWCVINIGTFEGVQLHQIFTVVRDDKYVAQVEVITVEENRSVCRIKPESVSMPVRVGDRVRPPAYFGASEPH